MPPAIPQELSDLIIDFLYNDVSALCSAGLVCKSWLPASRFHLFSRIKLSSWNVPHFLELICAEGSIVLHHIVDFAIRVDEIQMLEEMLLRLPLLSNLKTLRLSHINMASLTPDAKKRLNIMFRNLTSLTFFDFIVRNYFFALPRFILSHLRNWISLKPLIKRLILLRPPLVWRMLNFGMSLALSATVKAPIILRRQLPHP
jgi:hypothetical protein